MIAVDTIPNRKAGAEVAVIEFLFFAMVRLVCCGTDKNLLKNPERLSKHENDGDSILRS